ncbi:lysine N(6)-hydroxylase/L-ornithine N(5)-oxygenase family protein [Aldersonia kunmingensis]|uniref:lysine N(6)-hydroxylase/L-ornithine N(5)-oxygenase family protein n=1 Tax=Aldersonia kunmingensis TaxID=408066 RepID=UPI00082DDC28|nr:SidA/IucD/PvdA family monooxygenase [Aldersonia kunmingensis]
MTNTEIVDIAGIGFGPSNLALAIALEEFNAERDARDQITAQFIESKEEFGWHPGMLLPGTTMQVSFLKDLATQRNVRSRYSFLNYLAEARRLPDFINHQTFFPSRIEFHDYLEWSARTVDAQVAYGTRAESIENAGDHFEILMSGHQSGVLRARNVVVATGLFQRLPAGVTASNRVFHNHQLLSHLECMPEPTHQNFVVLGAGQSAAEVVSYLHSTYPDASVHAVFAKYGYSPADDSPYANRIFDATAVDDYHASSPEFRARLMGYHRGTNYSAVDLQLIEELYAREYTERVTGQRRLFMHGASNASAVDETADGVTVTVVHEPTGLTEELVCDAVVCATGFHPMNLRSVLGNLADVVVMDPQGPRVARDYRLVTKSPLPGGVFLQGGTEHTHGISSSLLSNVAVRSGEIVRSVARDQQRQPSTVDSTDRVHSG